MGDPVVKYNEISDEELMRLISQNEDKLAFDEIYKRYEKVIYNYLNRLVFDKDMLNEIFQEVFSKVYFKASSFKIKYSFKSWIYKIAMNQYIDYYKGLKKHAYLSEKPSELKKIKYDTPEFVDNLIEEETIEYLKAKINELPNKYRQAIILKKLEGFTFDEVAEMMGVTSRSVKTYVAKGIELLKNKLNDS